ncbi:LOW QUALITY PROTEIN: hypothetical protein Cgig2_016839 [Carnegiea gigantea]|uniref:Uncharacterized protein n=1 Tax=Carnegiea gigantea TaxID=171969 RepID=A0A9Q1GKE7_9CARY|nr:LOW QUALITY PROTEIN: hypothetical protein Cgig2_016839 [Carnegiea gigantea]
MKFEKKQRGEKLGETKKEKAKKKAFPKGHISEVEISDSLDDKESNARAAESKDESSDRSPEKLQEEKEPYDKSPTKLEHKERQEKGEETKEQEPKKKAVTARRSQRVRGSLRPTVQQGHISESSDAVENSPTHEHEEVDHNANEIKGDEETCVHEALEAILKTRKLVLKSEGKQAIKKKDNQLSASAALPEEKITSSGQDVQMASQQWPLKYDKGGNEKRMYQKAFITRMTKRSFSSMVAKLNEARTEAVRSMGFTSFFKVDLKQILGKKSFDPYSASFMLTNGQRFTATTFDVYVTLGVSIRGREIMEITRSLTNEEYDEVHATWHNAPKLTCIPEFNLAKKDWGESFKRNIIIYLKLITSVKQYKESKSAKGVHFDGPFFFLMPKKKKKTEKKAKIESKNNEELTSKKHTHDKQTEKAKEKEGLPNKSVAEVAEKRKPGKDHADKRLSKKAKREKFPLDLGKDGEPARKSAAKGEENKQSNTAAKNTPSKDEGCQKSPKKPEDREKHIQKAPTKLEKKEKGEKEEETKKHKLKEKPLPNGQSERMRQLSKVDHDDDQIEAKEEVVIHKTVKPTRKRNKRSLQSKGDGAALVLVKPTSSAKDLQFEVRALKFKDGASEKRTYQKAFITRMTTRSFSSLVAQLNKAQAKAVKSIRFASFLKVDLKKIPWKFLKWLVKCFDLYVVCFRLPDG